MSKMLLANTLRPFSDPFHRRTPRQKYFLLNSPFFHHLAPIVCINKTIEICAGVKRIAIKSHRACAFLEYLPAGKPDYGKAGLSTRN